MTLRLSYDVGTKPGLKRHVQGYILLELQEMAASEMLEHIPAETHARIKKQDPNPVYRAYVVAHEGLSHGKIVGAGEMAKRWVQSAIRKIFDKLKTGLKLFHQHGKDNRHEGRTPIGELVGKTTSYIKDKLTAIAIAYIKPEYRSLPLDVASIEADITIPDGEQITSVNVESVTGIALGNSNVNKPGFAGAELIGELQAFVDNQTARRKLQMADVDKITIDELRTLVKDERISPSDIFSEDTLVGDPFVKGYTESKIKERIGGEYKGRKTAEETMAKKEQEWEKKEKELTEKISNLTKAASESKVKSLFEKAKEERKLSEQQVKFIEKRLGNFKPESLEYLDKQLDKHLDLELDEFKEYAETFGIEIEESEGNGREKEGEPKIKANIKKEAEGEIDNPFLPPLDD